MKLTTFVGPLPAVAMSYRVKATCRSTILTASLAILVAGTLTAADDPLIGKWKFNQDKSKTSALHLKIEDLGANKYRIGGTIPYEVVADGTYQPREGGGTRSLTIVDANTWKSVTRQNGGVDTETTWRVSADGKTLTTHTTRMNPDGSKTDVETLNTRIGGVSGFVGTWESKAFRLPGLVLEIQPYPGGISIVWPVEQNRLDLRFDGKDYADQGLRADKSMLFSGKRLSSDAIQVLDKHNGKLVYSDEYKVSADGRTLTITVQSATQPVPEILVFDRQ